ncbi:MAG: thermitase [Actinomycetota bacterium]|jgi:subtilisin family serine protease|nr:thermitase [Actinomycetota bacterium]
MRKLCVAVVAILAVTASALLTPLASASPATKSRLAARAQLSAFQPRSVPGEVIVKFRKSSARMGSAAVVRASGASTIAGPIGRFRVLKAPAGISTTTLIHTLEANPTVAYAEPNYLRYLSMTPNDTRFSQQWALNNTGQSHPMSNSNAVRLGTADADMDVAEAWDTQQGDSETVIAIMDSGVDVSHPDLAANIWVNSGEIAGNGVDDDGNGYKDDINGWDFADNDAGLLQATGNYAGYDHGTHVAGIIGAVANNSTGISGVCPGCRLMVLKMFKPFDTDGDGTKDTMVGDIAGELKAFDYAIDMGADVINGSFGASVVSTRSERAKIKKAIASGITMVFAAGNENSDNDLLITSVDFDGDQVSDMTSPSYPASYDLAGIISVAASNDGDQNAFQSACFADFLSSEWPCTFTNWGHESVDVSAPGVDIVSTLPNNTYAAFDGTSMAAPAVSGVAGLVIAQHPDYTPTQVANAIMNSADHPAGLQTLNAFPSTPAPTADYTVTAGRVNAAAALDAPTTDNFPTTDGTIAGAKAIKGSVSGSVSWPEDTNDVYKKKLVKGATYKAVLNGAGTADLDLQIYKPGTDEIWQFDDRCFTTGGGCPVLFYDPNASGDASKRFTATKAGTYYFHVNAWLLNTANYSLKITRV